MCRQGANKEKKLLYDAEVAGGVNDSDCTVRESLGTNFLVAYAPKNRRPLFCPKAPGPFKST
jgi:hypothetical protein